MAHQYEADQWQRHVMNWHDPHQQIEPLAHEIEAVDGALAALVDAGILPHPRYDHAKFLAHRAAVRDHFDIPWTAITPRMQRLLYAINAIAQPRVMVAVGIFCGNTFISNAGAAIGPGAAYQAQRLVGLEINPEEAARARRNVASIDAGKAAEVLAQDGIPWLRDFTSTIDLLYLDADGTGGRGKSIYLDLVETGLHALHPGSLVLAHNSVNCAGELADYLDHMRNPTHFHASMNMVVDDQGLEVSLY
ncbi:MAG: class I SAM-dependent methyltransferase [Chloroflexi bacterium]|nr:class I SAM-dependent methyltransferase [Chloroflexota bacterium]